MDKILGIMERLGQAHRAFLQDLATRHGLTPLQVQVIGALGEGPPPPPYVGDIARELGITQPSASDAVAALEAKGYILRLTDQQDRRRIALTLTDAGIDLDLRLADGRQVLRDALGTIPANGQGPVLDSMQQLLTSLANADVLSPPRNCHTCRHLRRSATGHSCAALQLEMTSTELRVNCAHHEPFD